ncbi:MAG: NAD(P)-dependent oxidoreductase [Boseongicola sp.]|nr:NAD(P)-dependent oxidoreductase [Boseongicola sp.]
MKVGFIGLGAMGLPMTARLAEAFPGNVVVFDPNPSAIQAAVTDFGVTAGASIADVAERVDVLFTCVPNNDTVRSVYLREDGVAPAIREGAITIDCSTVGPDATRDVYAGLKAVGAQHLDASMLGSVKQANEGTISFVVGGDADAFERALPALKACGEMIRHCGGSGAGNHMKLIHQTLVAGHAAAVAEAMGLCLETGADVEAFYDIVTQGTGFAYSRYFENRVPRMRDGDFSPLFFLRFMLKDARLARDMAANPEAYPVLASVIATMEDAEALGHGDADFSATMKALEARLGVAIAKS